MAKQTHSGRGYPLYGDPTLGADLAAPTAPHATSGGRRTGLLSGPARFWDARRARLAASVATLLSVVVHWVLSPWQLLPSNTGIEFKDPNGELSIPVDLLGEEAPPEPPAPAPAPSPAEPASKELDPNAARLADAGAKPALKDAGVDATMLAAQTDAGDAGGDTDSDGGTLDDGGLVALADASTTPGSDGPRDPAAMFGLTKVINAGVQNVVLGVNVALVRQHPVGSRMGPVLQAIPQWRDFLKGAPTPVDPIRDADWILIYGPSLIHTDKDAVLVRYNVDDPAIDTTIAAIARTYDKGGPYDAGVPGVKASLGFADNAQRVFLRPQTHLLVIVPPSHATEAAKAFRKQVPRGPSPTEAMRLIVHNPMNQVAIPGLKFPESLTELRLWIIPSKDGAAEVYAEGDCTDEGAAVDSAEKLTGILKRTNSLAVRFATRGLLNNAEVVPDGKKVTLHITATVDQLEAVLQVVAAAVNAQVPPPPAPSASERAHEPL